MASCQSKYRKKIGKVINLCKFTEAEKKKSFNCKLAEWIIKVLHFFLKSRDGELYTFIENLNVCTYVYMHTYIVIVIAILAISFWGNIRQSLTQQSVVLNSRFFSLWTLGCDQSVVSALGWIIYILFLSIISLISDRAQLSCVSVFGQSAPENIIQRCSVSLKSCLW